MGTAYKIVMFTTLDEERWMAPANQWSDSPKEAIIFPQCGWPTDKAIEFRTRTLPEELRGRVERMEVREVPCEYLITAMSVELDELEFVAVYDSLEEAQRARNTLEGLYSEIEQRAFWIDFVEPGSAVPDDKWEYWYDPAKREESRHGDGS